MWERLSFNVFMIMFVFILCEIYLSIKDKFALCFCRFQKFLVSISVGLQSMPVQVSIK
jgi:hypothetical protein